MCLEGPSASESVKNGDQDVCWIHICAALHFGTGTEGEATIQKRKLRRRYDQRRKHSRAPLIAHHSVRPLLENAL